ncbi:MAG: hypothetical protein Q8Q89_02230 [bacterium]|nr:hypothetical protein [bacterium]
MSLLNRSASRSISVFLIPFVIFYISGLFIAVVSWAPNTAEAVSSDIFSDGFESEDFSSWTSSDGKWDVTSGGSTDAHDGSARADVKGNTGESDDVLLNNVSTGGHENISLSFWYKTKDSLEEDEHVYVEWTANGSNWNVLADFTDIDEDEDWVKVNYDLSEEANDNESFGLRLRAQLGSGSDKFYLDDVLLSGDVSEESPTPTPTPEPEGGKISGYKFEDLDGDGKRDEGEPLLNGWTIWLDEDSYAVTGDDEKGWADGYYEFDDLESDDYTVCEERKPSEESENNWTQTYPSNNVDEEDDYYDYIYESCDEDFGDHLARYGYNIEIEADGAKNVNFGNINGNIVKAFKFKDLDMNSTQDEGESALEGWNMCLYQWNSSGEEGEEGGGWSLVDGECKPTDDSGWATWTNLDFGLYRLDEEDRSGWTHTTDNYYEFELDEENVIYERKFGNIPNELEVIKFYDTNGNGDQDDNEEVLSGWEFCLYKIVWPGDEDSGPVYEPVSEDYCRKTDENGSVLWSELEEGDYLVDEEERENWFHTNWGEEGRAEVEVEEGRVVERFGNVRNVIRVLKFWDKNQNGSYEPEEGDKTLSDWQMCLYDENNEGSEPSCKNTDETGYAIWEDADESNYHVVEESKDGWVPINTENGQWSFEVEDGEGEVLIYFGNDTTSIDAHKFYDINQNGVQDYWVENLLEPDIRGWKMCLYRWLSSGEEDGQWQLIGECKSTDDDGLVHWTGLAPDLYRFEEEGREDLGWSPVTVSSYVFELGYLENREFDFGNWIPDENPPISQFDDVQDHQVIDTEMVSMSLTGQSVDQESGVQSATLSVYQLGGPESVVNYPASSFFDIFVELRCPVEPREEPPLIPIELVSLSLVSVNPITVSWGHNWVPPSTGTYCFEVKATDYAGNIEHTAWSGPLAYVPTAQISEQESSSVTENSFTVEWDTDKPATSRIIYDTISHPNLGEAPNYGYAFSTPEQDLEPKVISHSVVVNDLTTNTTYYYRTISAASPESVGGESSTTTSGGSGGNNGGGGGGGAPGSIILNGPTPTPSPISLGQATPTPSATSTPLFVAGATTSGGSGVSESSAGTPGLEEGSLDESDQTASSPSVTPEASEEDQRISNNNLFAFLGGLFDSVSWWWLLILPVVIIVIAYTARKKKDQIL